jgi:hypothetical protein
VCGELYSVRHCICPKLLIPKHKRHCRPSLQFPQTSQCGACSSLTLMCSPAPCTSQASQWLRALEHAEEGRRGLCLHWILLNPGCSLQSPREPQPPGAGATCPQQSLQPTGPTGIRPRKLGLAAGLVAPA